MPLAVIVTSLTLRSHSGMTRLTSPSPSSASTIRLTTDLVTQSSIATNFWGRAHSLTASSKSTRCGVLSTILVQARPRFPASKTNRLNVKYIKGRIPAAIATPAPTPARPIPLSKVGSCHDNYPVFKEGSARGAIGGTECVGVSTDTFLVTADRPQALSMSDALADGGTQLAPA